MVQKKNKSDDLVITFDPSMAGWGYTVIRPVDNYVVVKGCIKTESEQKKRRIRKGDDTVRRISELNRFLQGLLESYKIRLILTELPHGSQTASSAQMIGIVTGVTQTLSDAYSIPIEYYSEADAKKAVLNRKSVTKEETIQAINKLYSVKWTGIKYIDEAVADSMAVYHVAAISSGSMLKMLMKL